MTAYSCQFSGEISKAVKSVANKEYRSMRNQFHMYVLRGLEQDGYSLAELLSEKNEVVGVTEDATT